MGLLQIYSPQDTPSLAYISEFFFENILGLQPVIVTEYASIDPSVPLINYSATPLPNSLHIVPNGYLFASDYLKFPSVKLSDWEGIPIFFETEGDIPFDVFAAAFFLLSRAEEYVSTKRGLHDRFEYDQSVFSNSDMINRPVIDEWVYKLGKILSAQFDIKIPPRKFKWINTIDVDVAYAYKGRSLFRAAGAAFRELIMLRWGRLGHRFLALAGYIKDPFDTYELVRQLADNYPESETKFFFLLGKKGKYDHGLHYKSTRLKKLIVKVAAFSEVGIHPSYASYNSHQLVNQEKLRLSAILKKHVTISRFHFLRLKFPQSYQTLLHVGITTDYTLGYAGTPGFRAGTCTPFFFFDLHQNRRTNLKLVPLTVMDASLKNYVKLTPGDAADKIQQLIENIKGVDGTFVSLWHNDAISDWQEWRGWRDVYLKMAEAATTGKP